MLGSILAPGNVHPTSVTPLNRRYGHILLIVSCIHLQILEYALSQSYSLPQTPPQSQVEPQIWSQPIPILDPMPMPNQGPDPVRGLVLVPGSIQVQELTFLILREGILEVLYLSM